MRERAQAFTPASPGMDRRLEQIQRRNNRIQFAAAGFDCKMTSSAVYCPRLKRLRKIAVLAALGFASYQGLIYWREHRFDAVIAAAARHYNLDPALVKAVVWEESRFDPGARGRAGELGLMQIRDSAAREWAASEHIQSFDHRDCLDPATNVQAGAFYLKKVARHYNRADDPTPYALAEYNAGRGNVLKWLNGAAATNSGAFIAQIGFPSTKAYVVAILGRRNHYRR